MLFHCTAWPELSSCMFMTGPSLPLGTGQVLLLNPSMQGFFVVVPASSPAAAACVCVDISCGGARGGLVPGPVLNCPNGTAPTPSTSTVPLVTSKSWHSHVGPGTTESALAGVSYKRKAHTGVDLFCGSCRRVLARV